MSVCDGGALDLARNICEMRAIGCAGYNQQNPKNLGAGGERFARWGPKSAPGRCRPVGISGEILDPSAIG